MINVSDKYREKAMAPGRKVKCEIMVGDFVYDDTQILSFEFNDVVHPEDMSFGTTCANRFHFQLWSRRSIPLTAVIKPFVIFTDEEGDSEPCPLGEFYISHRYRRRTRINITSYDKMSRLDSRYRPRVEFPCATGAILADIAVQFDFEVGFAPAVDVISSVPRTATCREVIGYIAGLNGGFAKFDRAGVLRLRNLAPCGFELMRNQYSELALKADELEIRRVELVTDTETYAEGRGTKFTTYRQYNPFADFVGDAAIRRIYDKWSGYTYRGMTIKMRGLPFLESGDSIMVQDDYDDTMYHALISDYTLEYDGGLRGRLISKAKNPIDEFDAPNTQQRIWETLSDDLSIRYFNYINEELIGINQGSALMVDLKFMLGGLSSVAFNSQFTVTADSDCTMTLDYNINGVKTGQTPRTTLFAGKPLSVSLYYLFEKLKSGGNTLTVTANISAGSGVVEARELIATISGQHLVNAVVVKPDTYIWHRLERMSVGGLGLSLAEMNSVVYGQEEYQPDTPVSDRIEAIRLQPMSATPRGLRGSIDLNSVFKTARQVSPNQIILEFTNSVTFSGAALSGIRVLFEHNEVGIVSQIIRGSEITLTTENLSMFNEVVIQYDSDIGNLLGAASQNPVDSFNYILVL
jgi:hypothetical protein